MAKTNALKPQHHEYFEGILQLRNYDQELLEYVLNAIEKDRRAVVTKTIKVNKNCVDLYLTSQKYLRILGSRLRQNFCGVFKETATLHTQKKGKDLYRITILFDYLPLKRGQNVTFRGDDYEIISWDKRVLLKNRKSGEKVHVSFADFRKLAKIL
ncbi:hypothetical protein HZA97_05440 [Candidatus Woesearchaeota archaeon]|nr:hypothetical protein [Candidatus Woesearchaeota archaeon]